MGIEAIAGLVVVILGAIAGAFGIGHARGTSKAEAKADQQRTEETPLLLSPPQNDVLKSRKGPVMYRKTLSVWVMTMLIASCASTSPAPVVVDTACSWVRVIYLTDHDIDVLDKQTKRDILAHNKAVQANCP